MERAITRVHGRPVLQRALRVVAIGVVLGGVPIGRAQAAQERGDDSAIATIQGTIVLRGCVPISSEIDLRAEPIRVSRLGSEGAVDPRATDLIARIARTAEPRTLRFTISGVQPSKPYHLTIAQQRPGNCGRIFWRGPFAGLAISGGPRVTIEGFAATTEVEVLDQTTDEWVGTDGFSPDDSSASRRFRWRSSLPEHRRRRTAGVDAPIPQRGELRCLRRTAGRHCLPAGNVPAGDGAWAGSTVSFGAIFGRGITPPDGIAAAVALVDARTRQLVRLGAPVYIRVVPFRDDGPACDIEESGVPGWVIMSNIPGEVADPPEPPPAPPILEPGNDHLYRPPYVDDGRPTYGEGAYKVLEDHQLPSKGSDGAWTLFDRLGIPDERSKEKQTNGCSIIPGDVYKVRDGWRGGGGGLVDVLGSFATGLGGALSVGVNAAANVWNDAIAGVKSLALDVLITLPGVGKDLQLGSMSGKMRDCRQQRG